MTIINYQKLRQILSKVIHSARPEICMDVAAWAKQRDYPVLRLHPPVMEEVKPYIGDDVPALEEFNTHRSALERPQTLVTIDRAIVRDVVGFIELPDGQICYEGNWWLPYLQAHPAYQRRFLKNQRRLKGNVYSLLCLWAPEFYHWFHDVLPRLETALSHLPSDTKFLINEKPKSWQLDSLVAYGIGPERLEDQPVGVYTTVERLWFATPIGHTSFGSGAILLRVSGRLLRHFQISELAASRARIFVSRRKAKFRLVSNEAELEPILKDRGFEIVCNEDLSFKEQLRQFAHANAVVGPHGAGLTNIIHCPTNSRIGEILTTAEGGSGIHYMIIARQVGLTFNRFEAKPVRLAKNQSDMQVDPTKFSEWLAHGFPQKA